MAPRWRILVVDDEPRSLELLVRTLRGLGDVHTAGTAEEAWALAQALSPDLVMADQRMAGTSGVELLARVAERDESTARVLLTGYADIGPTIDAINRGRVHAYVSKPWAPEQLRLTAQTLLDRVALTRERERLLDDLVEKNQALERAMASLGVAQQRFVDAERLGAIGRMVAMIVHDFRGPLTSIRSLAGELARGGDALPGSEVREIGDSIFTESERMSRMCSELLDATRAGAGPIARVETEIDEFVEDVLAFVTEEASQLGVTLETDLRAGVSFPIDADRVRRALLNLVYNAIEAMPEGGALRVTSEREGQELRIGVIDNGCGIAPEIRDRLFEPFVTHGKGRGSGLGLAVVKKVMDDHGGSVEVGKPEGGGTSIQLRFPIPADAGS